LIYVEAVIHPRGDDPNWGGWFFESKGRTPWEGASRVSYAMLKDIMKSSPEVLVHALTGVVPRNDPCTSVWSQPKGMSLEGGTEEGQSSSNAAMRTCGYLEASFGCLNDAYLSACDERRQLRREYESEIDSLRDELAKMTLQRDKAMHMDEVAVQDIRVLREQQERLTLAHQNCECMLVHVLNQGNEA
jgi:hypothetical protein